MLGSHLFSPLVGPAARGLTTSGLDAARSPVSGVRPTSAARAASNTVLPAMSIRMNSLGHGGPPATDKLGLAGGYYLKYYLDAGLRGAN